jgi:hypothetical protein
MMFQWKVSGGSPPPAFSPADLIPSAWFSAMTASSLWQDTGATSAVTAVTQTIARANDLSTNARHATQATAGSRPTYSRIPVGGRRNLLTFTEQLDNAEWAKVDATVTANAGLAPDGTMTADKIVGNVIALGQRRCCATQNATMTNAVVHILSFYAKEDDTPHCVVNVDNGSGNLLSVSCNLNTGAGSVFYYSGITSDPADSITVGAAVSGWRRVEVKFLARGGFSRVLIGSSASAPTALVPFWWNSDGDGVRGVLVWGAQLEAAATVTAYQRVVTARDVTQSGVSDVFYMFDDGGDSLNWTAPVGTYDIAYVNSLGTVTVLTSQALSGAVDVTIPTDLVEYVAVNRTLTAGEVSQLTTYLQARANPL